MSIELRISLEQLADENVSAALAELVRALGGGGTARTEVGRRPTSPTTSWEEFHASLSPNTQRFIGLVEQWGTLSMGHALDELPVTKAKAMGGLTGALARKAANVGIDLPYRQRKAGDGERIWVWRRTWRPPGG